MKNKRFMKFLIFNTIWAIANNITTPFLSTYQIKELGFSMSFIAAVTVALSFLNMLAVYLTGKYSIKHSYSSILFASFVFGLIGFALILFTNTVNSHVMFTIYRIFTLFFGATSSVSITSLLFSIVSENERTSALAFKSIITGLFGFVTTLLINPLFFMLQNSDITLFGVRIFAQQALALISFIITAFLIIYYAIFCRHFTEE